MEQPKPRACWVTGQVGRYLAGLICIVGLISCQAGGAANYNRYSEVNAELGSLAIRFDQEGYTSLESLPEAGASEYQGYLAFRLSNADDLVSDSIAGELTLVADFARSEFSVSGNGHGFVDDLGNELSGQVELSAGSLDREGDPAIDATVSFNAEGVLTDHLSQELELELLFEGDFFGVGPSGIGGNVAGLATSTFGQHNIGGVFIAEMAATSQ